VHFVDDEGGGAPAAVYARKWTAVGAAAAKRLFPSGEQRAELELTEAEDRANPIPNPWVRANPNLIPGESWARRGTRL